jgi:hypothetical protein
MHVIYSTKLVLNSDWPILEWPILALSGEFIWIMYKLEQRCYFQVFILRSFLCYRQTQVMYHEVYQSGELCKLSTGGQRDILKWGPINVSKYQDVWKRMYYTNGNIQLLNWLMKMLQNWQCAISKLFCGQWCKYMDLEQVNRVTNHICPVSCLGSTYLTYSPWQLK